MVVDSKGGHTNKMLQCIFKVHREIHLSSRRDGNNGALPVQRPFEGENDIERVIVSFQRD